MEKKKKPMSMIEEDAAFFRNAMKDPAIKKAVDEETAFQKKFTDRLYAEETKKLAGRKKKKESAK